MTEPTGTVVLDAVVMAPTVNSAPVMAALAAACVCPTTFGTATCGKPDEMTRATALPIVTWVPAAGDSLITEPAGTVVLDAVVITPTVRLTLVIAVVAAAWLWPTTFGTATCGKPDEMTRATALPIVTWVPAAGDSLITEPAGTVVLDAVVTAPTVNSTPVMAALAAAWV